MMPKSLPSVSWQLANHPTPGMAVFGITTLPPLFSILARYSSTEGTPIVFRIKFYSALRLISAYIKVYHSGHVHLLLELKLIWVVYIN
jgi:hypothetical protein